MADDDYDDVDMGFVLSLSLNRCSTHTGITFSPIQFFKFETLTGNPHDSLLSSAEYKPKLHYFLFSFVKINA